MFRHQGWSKAVSGAIGRVSVVYIITAQHGTLGRCSNLSTDEANITVQYKAERVEESELYSNMNNILEIFAVEVYIGTKILFDTANRLHFFMWAGSDHDVKDK